MNSNFKLQISNFQKALFVLLLIFLPSQLGLHFWPSWAYVNGIRVDYFSPTVYFTDVLVLFLVLLEIFNFKFSIYNQFSKFKSSKKLLGLGPQRLARTASALALTGLLILFNCYFSLSPALTIYKWLKVVEFGFLVWFITKNVHHSIKLEHVYVMLLIPVVYESVLAIWQYLGQASVGGLWYFLGERTFNSSTPGIANAFINGSLVMRPYGTFSHPNVLGGFMLISLLIILCYFPRISRKITAAVLALGTSGLFLSLSRTAIFAGLVSSAFFLRKRVLVLLILLALLFSLPRFTSLLVETEPIVAREQLNSLSIEQWKKSPLFGTGLGTSPIYTSNIKNYALAHQPTHNIYLLILSETGLVGFAIFAFVVSKTLKKPWLILPILLIGFFDHYFLTLQQGQLLFSVVLGLVLVRRPSPNRSSAI